MQETQPLKLAPELRVSYWIDAEGHQRVPLHLPELGTGFKFIYCFQAWCPGCHESGFPNLRKLVHALRPKGFGFAAIQTVFEGESENTPARLREMQTRYELDIPFGHDQVENGHPTFMQDYQTGGTPWFVLISPKGEILFSDFHLNADVLIDGLAASAAS